MQLPFKGAIDCDMHPELPSFSALMPYLDEFWQDHLADRHIDRFPFTLQSYVPSLPTSARPDWRSAKGVPGGDFETFRAQALDVFGCRYAIANVLHGAIGMFNADMVAAICTAVNRWVAAEWLDRDPRMRASILVPPQDIDLAVAEVERCAMDSRFVQVLFLVMGDMPLGNRRYWPIFRAAEKHGLPICVHAGSLARHSPTGSGWPSTHLEDQIVLGPAFEDLVVSFVIEGVFQKFPNLKLVLAESGFTWLPTLLWRNNKVWRGARTEIPWVDRPPADIVRDHVRFTLQPLDAPNGDILNRILDHVRSDRLLLFSTDYPHWHFEGAECLPDGLSGDMVRKILVDNPLDTYPRLRAETALGSGVSTGKSEAVP